MDLGGSGVGVAFVDTDGHFDVFRLVQIMEGQISAAIGAENVQFYNGLIKDSLARLYVCRPRNTVELLCTLRSMPCLFKRAGANEVC